MIALTSMPDIGAKSKRNAGHKELHMTALILPFPITRRHGFIQRQVAHAARMNYDSCVRYVERQLTIQRDTMRRRHRREPNRPRIVSDGHGHAERDAAGHR
jgi:hypothetical protein